MGNLMINVSVVDAARAQQFADELGMEVLEHSFSGPELSEWKGYSGGAQPEGAWDRTEEWMFTPTVEQQMTGLEHGFSTTETGNWNGYDGTGTLGGLWDREREAMCTFNV